MMLIFEVDSGSIKIHRYAKFREAELIGWDFRGLNAFCVRALEKEKKKEKKELWNFKTSDGIPI